MCERESVPEPTRLDASHRVGRVTPEHPDAIAYRRTAEAFRTGDLGLLESLIASDVVLHVPPATIRWRERSKGAQHYLNGSLDSEASASGSSSTPS